MFFTWFAKHTILQVPEAEPVWLNSYLLSCLSFGPKKQPLTVSTYIYTYMCNDVIRQHSFYPFHQLFCTPTQYDTLLPAILSMNLFLNPLLSMHTKHVYYIYRMAEWYNAGLFIPYIPFRVYHTIRHSDDDALADHRIRRWRRQTYCQAYWHSVRFLYKTIPYKLLHRCWDYLYLEH